MQLFLHGYYFCFIKTDTIMEEKKHSWPPEEADFPGWMDNFYKFVDLNAALLGFTAPEVLWLKARSEAASFAELVIEASRKQLSDYVNLRNIQYLGDPENVGLLLVNWIPLWTTEVLTPTAVAPNAKATLDGMVKRVASNNDITRDQKRDAGVLPRERTKINPNDATPVLKVKVVNGQAVLDCPLVNFKGYLIYAEDNNGAAISLGNSTARKYTDTRPLPTGVQTEQRAYFVRYVGNNNTPVGNFSNKVTVAVLRIV